MSSVKSGEEFYKITYAQAIETKSRIKISLSRTEIKGSLGGARKTAVNMRKLAFFIKSFSSIPKQSKQAAYLTQENLNRRYHEQYHRHPCNHSRSNNRLEFGPVPVLHNPLCVIRSPCPQPASERLFGSWFCTWALWHDFHRLWFRIVHVQRLYESYSARDTDKSNSAAAPDVKVMST